MSHHEAHMREAFAFARNARAHGNRPLVAGNGAVLAAAENSLAKAGRKVEVVGPVLESEAEALFADGVF